MRLIRFLKEVGRAVFRRLPTAVCVIKGDWICSIWSHPGSPNQAFELFGRPAHLQEDQAQLGVFARQGRQHRFFTHGSQQYVPAAAANVHLLQPAAPQL